MTVIELASEYARYTSAAELGNAEPAAMLPLTLTTNTGRG
jgi:hypothetical protein